MSYNVKILADSISPDDVRLTTLEVTFPRFILAEVNTHRMLSRNSASSRAIPTEKIIERVQKNPFIPETFNKRVKGMGVGEALEGDDLELARHAWLMARNAAVAGAMKLSQLDTDKSRANRLLEPFMWHTAIISATEWENFFALRDHPAAQPEFQIVARMMREAMGTSIPVTLDYRQWHLPLVSVEDYRRYETDDQELAQQAEVVGDWAGDWETVKKLSASRCARVSFDTQHDDEPHEKTLARAEMLMGNGHLSPFEHVARPMDSREYGADPTRDFRGNFRGWFQMRKEIPHESNFRALTEATV